MIRTFLVAAAVLLTQSLFSQKIYFVYLQTDPAQPFYARIQDKVYSSAASGYLVLSKLRDTIYTITVGFPANKWPEQSFTIPINTKDHGYLLKDFGEKGWGLYDLQTMSVLMNTKEAPKPGGTAKTDNKEVSEFTDILSKAADDPSLKEKNKQAQPEEKKAEVVAAPAENKTEPVAAVKKDTVAAPAIVVAEPVVKKEEPVVTPPVINNEPPKIEENKVKPAEVKEPAVVTEKAETQPEIKPVQEEFKRSVVIRRSESSTTEGFGLVFIDVADGTYADTIRLIIPNPKPVVSAPAVVKEEPKEEKKFLDVAPPVVDSVAARNENKPAEEKPAAVKAAVNNCPATADDNDFLKVRKKMAAAASDDAMIAEAKKYFKTKCFNTVQIKNLSLLFLNDEGKYRFFDMSYAYVTDMSAFPSLQAELKDDYYINRFKAILR